MASEAAGQLKSEKKAPTHVFLQAGVGAMAGGVMAYLAEEYREDSPVFCVVEPETANCVFCQRAEADGEICSVEGNPDTIMAGLNCGTPCGVTWPILRDLPAFISPVPTSCQLTACGFTPILRKAIRRSFPENRSGDRWSNRPASQRKGADRDQRAAASK